jgi:Tetratricopeptide repeat
LAIEKRLAGGEQPDRELAIGQSWLGGILAHSGRLDEAETLARSSVDNFTKLFGPDNVLSAGASFFLASVLEQNGKLDEAEQIGRRGLAAYRKQPDKHFSGGSPRPTTTGGLRRG